MRVRMVKAVVYKQTLDILKNKMIVFMMFLYPFMTLTFKLLLINQAEIFSFVFPVFVTMHIIMAPMLCFSSVISEEKENNTLKMLFLSDVRSIEYLFGIGLCLIFFLITSTIPYYFILDLTFNQAIILLFMSLFGFICSALLGSIIGIFAKNQTSVGTIDSPISMFIGLLPMMGNFNETIKKVSNILYSQRIYNIAYNYNNMTFDIAYREEIFIFFCNAAVLIVIFSMIYSERGLKTETAS